MEGEIVIGIPEAMVMKFRKDFEMLPGSEHRDSVLELRKAVMNILFTLWEHPDLTEDEEFKNDLVKAMAMRQAMCELGIFYDA
jgi:hypothetical protein